MLGISPMATRLSAKQHLEPDSATQPGGARGPVATLKTKTELASGFEATSR